VSAPLSKLLLRRGLHYPGRNWTRAHRQWIDSLTWTRAAERAVVDDYLLAFVTLRCGCPDGDGSWTPRFSKPIVFSCVAIVAKNFSVARKTNCSSLALDWKPLAVPGWIPFDASCVVN
jgi:hypothetical protein